MPPDDGRVLDTIPVFNRDRLLTRITPAVANRWKNNTVFNATVEELDVVPGANTPDAVVYAELSPPRTPAVLIRNVYARFHRRCLQQHAAIFFAGQTVKHRTRGTATLHNVSAKPDQSAIYRRGIRQFAYSQPGVRHTATPPRRHLPDQHLRRRRTMVESSGRVCAVSRGCLATAQAESASGRCRAGGPPTSQHPPASPGAKSTARVLAVGNPSVHRDTRESCAQSARLAGKAARTARAKSAPTTPTTCTSDLA